jgi:mRNA-degrading endonuclease RelE of RelBE toxin-antitoxin system
LNYKVLLNKNSVKEFKKLEEKNQNQIKSSLSYLKDFLSGKNEKMPDIKKLKGKYTGLYRSILTI